MSMSGGPCFYMRDRKCEFDDDGTFTNAYGHRMLPIFTRLKLDGSMTCIDTKIAIRIIRTVRTNQRRAARKGRLIRTHCCRCTCKCPAAWGVPKKKDQHNGLNAITHEDKQRHKAKLVDQTTQVTKTKIDTAVQVDTTKRPSADKVLFFVRKKDRRVLRWLVISESNLIVLSRFLGLVKFNTDEWFRTHILHKVNPLVHVERCPKIKEMVIEGFSTKLNLKHVTDARKNSVDSGNQSKPKSETQSSQEDNKSSSSQQRGAPSSSSDRTKKGKVTKPKVFRPDKKSSSSSSNSREYTPLEDAAIVRWICVGGASRERKVNGNQIWKQLQEEYSVLSGQERSWHSLRNRYLRHILPTLQRRGDVATAVATRLRAHAAMGQTKPAPDPAKESVRTVSAWSLRPRTPRLSHTPNDPRDPLNPLNPPSRRRPLFNPRSVGD